MPRAGRLRHRVLLQERVTITTPEASEEVTWVDRLTVWGAVEPVRGNEALSGGQILATMDTRIVLRWSPSIDVIDATWRVSHDGILYNIAQVVRRDLARREIEVMARSGANDG